MMGIITPSSSNGHQPWVRVWGLYSSRNKIDNKRTRLGIYDPGVFCINPTENRIANNADKEVLNEESVKVCSHWAVHIIISR